MTIDPRIAKNAICGNVKCRRGGRRAGAGLDMGSYLRAAKRARTHTGRALELRMDVEVFASYLSLPGNAFIPAPALSGPSAAIHESLEVRTANRLDGDGVDSLS